MIASSVQQSRVNRFTSLTRREYVYCDKQVRDLLQPDFYSTLNFNPEYQRPIGWTPDKMNAFALSVMKNHFISQVLTYQLQESDKSTGRYTPDTVFDYEVMDGQHRLYTLNAFNSAKLQKIPGETKEFIVHCNVDSVDEDGIRFNERFFHHQTEDTENWCREKGFTAKYLNVEEQKAFSNKIIKIATIVSKMTMDERTAEFLSLQNGEPVRNADLLKNKVEQCRLMAHIRPYGYQEMMRNTFLEHSSTKGKKYWTQWVARCFLLQKNAESPLVAFLLHDTRDLKKRIDKGHSSLNPSDDEFAEFHYKFLDFIEFLKDLDKIVLNITQINALFWHMCHRTYDREVLRSHMQFFAKEGSVKEYRTLWDKGDHEPRRQYFNRCLEQLQSMQEHAAPYDDRQITAVMKKKVWKTKFGESSTGVCVICRQTEITKESFECGHIKARALGGQTELDNLIPICRDCNRSMGTRDANKYRDDRYPPSVNA
jgi:5-methylcytosine-specific restriction endonuclease McrA